jgi:hypothetical protein
MVQNPSWETSSPSTLTINSSHFMEQEGSVQYWQQPTTLPDPNQFHRVHGLSPYFFQNNLLLSTRLRMGLLRGLFASRFPTKLVFEFLISHTCYMMSSSHTPWHVIPTTSGTQYEASYYEINFTFFSKIPILLPPPCPQNTLSISYVLYLS